MKVNLFIWLIVLFFTPQTHAQIFRDINRDTFVFYNTPVNIDEVHNQVKDFKITKDSTFVKHFEFNFGTLQLKLNTRFNSNINSINHYSLSSFIENFYNPLSFKYKGQAFEEGFLNIEIYKYNYTNSVEVIYTRILKSNFLVRIKKNMKLDTYIADKLSENLDSLNLICFTFSKEEETNILGRIVLGMYGNAYVLPKDNELVQLICENKICTRPVPISFTRRRVSKIFTTKDKGYSFQLIDNKGKQIMKTDTTSNSVKGYLDYYKKKPEVEILHMKEFKTKERFINYKIDWAQCDTCGKITELAKIEENEFIHLYEYCPPSDSFIKIKIGEISPVNTVKFIEKNWFFKNVTKGLTIDLSEGIFKPIYMECIVFDENKDLHFIKADNVNNIELKEIWNQFPDLGAIYIQNIVFLDNAGRKTRIPNTFLYYISK